MMRPDTGTREERQSFYQQYALQIANAKRVVIVGGGPIGVEMAGEISSHFPETQITLIESGSRILRGTSESASLHATRLLKKRGIQILTDDKLLNVSPKDSENSLEPKELVTAKGVQLSFDLLLWCTGAKPNTDYMQPYFSNALDLHQRICVTTSLRVVGEQMLFAVGDINNVNENKMAWHVAGQVECAEKNIRRVLAGQVDDSLLTQYKPQTGSQAMAVTFGPDEGMVNLPPLGLITAGWLNRRIKSSHMLVPKYRKILGV
jgi:NADH dehydrogenase FAD-containing subunit